MIKFKEKRIQQGHFDYLQNFFEEIKDKNMQNDKILRIEKYSQDQTPQQPTYKETIILQQVKDFEKNFLKQFPNRKLYLYPKNEFLQEKFLPTTIKPTLLEQSKYSNYQKCTLFFSNYIKYEQLENFQEPPEYAPSPHFVLQQKQGDSLDLAILQASFLLGSGYDCYIVMGKASKNITTRNESKLQYHLDLQQEQGIKLDIVQKKQKQEQNEFFFSKQEKLTSEVERKEQQFLKEQKLKEIEENKINDDEHERDQYDEYFGKRVHFWLLLQKKDEKHISENIFIDPVSSNTWQQNSTTLPFLKIDMIFNNVNVWINKNNDLSIQESEIDNFQNSQNWEQVIKIQQKEEQLEDYIFQEKTEEQMKQESIEEHKNILLDKPFSWVPRLILRSENIDQQNFCRFFEKVQIDVYPEYSQPDGLIKKLTRYQDYKKLLVDEVTFTYKNRNDNLYKRVRYPFLFKQIDYYNFNSQQNIKQNWPHWKEIEIEQYVKKIIRYYPLRFHDGLIERIEFIGEKSIEKYQNRDDKLEYLAVRFTQKQIEGKKDNYFFDDNNIGKVSIQKMVQKFEKNLQSKNQQISNIKIDLKRQKIQIFYHLGENQISPESYEVLRDEFTGITPNLLNKKDSFQDKTREAYTMEKECFSKIKFSEQQIQEDWNTFRTVFADKINKFKNSKIKDIQEVEELLNLKGFMKKKVNKNLNEDEEDNFDDFDKDIIGRTLKEKGLLGQKLTQEQKEKIKQEIIFNHQNRYIERSLIINQRFQVEKENVANKQKKFQQKANENIGKQEEKKLEEDLYNFNLKFGILEQRLLNFQKNAYEKYQELEQQLEIDPRLNLQQFIQQNQLFSSINFIFKFSLFTIKYANLYSFINFSLQSNSFLNQSISQQFKPQLFLSIFLSIFYLQFSSFIFTIIFSLKNYSIFSNIEFFLNYQTSPIYISNKANNLIQ